MRHTGVTLMLEHGINPRVIQFLAGWTSMRMLDRYGHVRDPEVRRAVTANAEHVAAITKHPGGTNVATATDQSASGSERSPVCNYSTVRELRAGVPNGIRAQREYRSLGCSARPDSPQPGAMELVWLRQQSFCLFQHDTSAGRE